MRGDTVYFCLKCKKAGTHEHKLQKLKAVPGELAAEQLMKQDKAEMNEEEKKSYLEGLLDEYYNLDFEDVIGGGSVKTRFKYQRVQREDFGLTEDEILLLEDKQLNKLVSLKKYRPYLDQQAAADDKWQVDPAVNVHRVRHLKRQLQEEMQDKRKMLKLSL
jgi:hypothetical protein